VAIVTDRDEHAAYVRETNGVIEGFHLCAICPCCLAKMDTAPTAVIDGMRRAYNRGLN
jgi:hypothetical protein